MLRELLLGAPEELRSDALGRPLRWGSELLQARCLRTLATRGERPDLVRGFLDHASPGLRRAAAMSLYAPRERELLGHSASTERTEEGSISLAVACVRAGAAPSLVDTLEARDARQLLTVSGLRSPMSTPARPRLQDRVWLALGEPRLVTPREELRRSRAGDLQALAALQHPGDFPALMAGLPTAGRRGEHTILLALGLSGDPRALAPLRSALQAVDVDPGRGFAQRRLAAIGLGRLGYRTATPWLLRALEDEARDFEGRPGAGLGIQYPVRADVIWALGELADPAAIPALITHLSDRQGSAFGGFYLPAMDALLKVGAPAIPALQAVAARGIEEAAAHAVVLLTHLGADPRPWRSDRRAQVRGIAEELSP